ncbi:MAG: sugar transferase [Bacteroidales bacterium]|nr:sugar transferase [Bacteroidales bacterium]
MNKRLLFVIVDIFILAFSFLFFAWLKPGTKAVVLPQYIKPFVFFLLVWVIASLTTKKYLPYKFKVKKEILTIILQANFSSLAVVTILIYTFKLFSVSRFMLFGTIALATVLEVFFAWLYNIVVTSPALDVENRVTTTKAFQGVDQDSTTISAEKQKKFVKEKKALPPELLHVIGSEFGDEVKDLISKYAGHITGNVQVVSTTTRFNIASLVKDKYNCLINLHRINDIRWLNKFFETVNAKLNHNGVFIGKAETYSLRKHKILRKYPIPFNYLIYAFDFLFRRVFPKLPVLKRIYFWVTAGQNRVISRAETLGRLYSCGFEILEEKYIGDEFYFVVVKTGEPTYPEAPSYGPIVRLKRIGKDGKFFYVYKMRTMHPFSEYLQEYVYSQNNLELGGKFKNDFRVNTLGKIMRKFWIDELPMLINVVRGDMKIVGVRPLSSHYFELYSDELKQKRIKCKPGLVPPFYADMPETLDEIMDSEMKYLEAYEKSPFLTDFRYFFLAWKNILFKKARSK